MMTGKNFRGKLGVFWHSSGGWLVFWGLLLGLELIHLKILFGEASFLAGGDNYTHLFLGRQDFYPYAWDNYFPFGTPNFTLPNLLGFPLYNYLLGFLSAPLLQRVLLFGLFFLKFLGFVKLCLVFAEKKTVSRLALVLATALLSFNAFASLNPFSYLQLLYGAYLPWSLYFFLKIFESSRLNLTDLAKATLFWIMASPLNANPALSLTVFLPQGVYFLINVRRLNAAKLVNLALYAFLFSSASLWWLSPMISYFLSLSGDFFAPGRFFSATQVGDLFQNFRFIGQWGWYAGHFLYPYYPYSRYYDHPLILVFSYLIVFVAWFEGLRLSREILEKRRRFFLLSLSVVGIFLVGGARPPFGVVYEFFFNHVFFFKIFREPFTKFSEIYVLALSLLFFLFLNRVLRSASRGVRLGATGLFLIAVVFAVKPGFLAEGVVARWNGSVRSNRISLPDYWLELERFVQENLAGARVLTTPKFSYGGAWNWPQGLTSAEDVAAVLLHNDNNVVRRGLVLKTDLLSLLDGFYNGLAEGRFQIQYLSLLGVDYVLQENDFDWRYGEKGTTAPRETTRLLESLERIASFGQFSKERLERIPNDEPNPFRRNLLVTQLLDLPPLALYKVPDNLRLPRLYGPQRVVLVPSLLGALPGLIENDLFGQRDIVVETKEASLFSGFPQGESGLGGHGARIFTINFPAIIEFTKINPTRYQIAVGGAPSAFVLQFIESFDPLWQLFLVRENGSKTIISTGSHFKSNGFANAWVVDPPGLKEQFGLSNNGHGAYNFDLVLEYKPQKLLNFYLRILIAVAGFCATVLVAAGLRSWRRQFKIFNHL